MHPGAARIQTFDNSSRQIMRRIVYGFTALTVLFWLFGLWYMPPSYDARGWSHEIFFVTGVVAWGWMALCLIIAVRPAWLERVTQTPLDSLYVWHRRLGWWALALAFVHFFTKTIFSPVIALFNLPRPGRFVAAENPDFWAGLWASLRPIANTSAEWLTWAMLVLCLLAVVRALCYTHWLKFHKILSIVFLGLTLHCVRLMDASDFMTPFGWLNLAVTAAGAVAALILLFRGPGAKLREEGTIVETEVRGSTTKWVIETPLAHRVNPGQFVFAATQGEPLHPFSVAGIEDGRITLMIRRLGDYTTDVVPNIPKGASVKLEGPWGAFRPVFDEKPQTWVAAGIGIAPFMAWLEAAAHEKHGPITLCWCIRDLEKEGFADEVKAACENAGVTLRVFESKVRRATVEELLADKPERLAICGGASLAKSLRKTWKGSPDALMTEEFHWRHAK